MIESNNLNELYPKYKRSLKKKHKRDAKTIASKHRELMDNILGELQDKLGVDCKTIKGDKRIEPEYFLQINKTETKDTVYNQTFCEELRNKYSCNDTVTLKCQRKGMKWTHWEDKAVLLDGVWIYRAHMGWFYPVEWTSDRYGLILREGHPVVQAEMRAHIAANEGVPLENVHEYVSFGGRGEGHTVHADENMYAFQVYRVHYKIRRGEEICEQWSEDWNETCRLQ